MSWWKRLSGQETKSVTPSRTAPSPQPQRVERETGANQRTSDQKCSNCTHRDGHNVCRKQTSPQFGQKVSLTDDCSHFLFSPGKHLYNEAVRIGARNFAVQDDAYCPERQQEVTSLLERAIGLGLPANDEVLARCFLADSRLDEVEDLSESPLLPKAIAEFEEAARLDREGQFGVLAEYRFMFPPWDARYCLMFFKINEQEGPKSAQRYLEDKLRLYKYLPSSPLYNVMNELAKHMLRTGDTARACYWLQHLVASEPVNPHDEEENQLRSEAQSMLQNLNR